MDTENIKKFSMLLKCRKTYDKRGMKLIEIVHEDDQRSAIANKEVLDLVWNTIRDELSRQIHELTPLAKADAEKRTTVYHLHCPGVSGRSEYYTKTAELYGMTEEEILAMVKKDCDDFRSRDHHKWCVENEKGEKVY